MSLAENTAVVSKYNWSGLHPDTVKGYATTVYKESHRLQDNWEFSIGDEGLFDIPRNKYVHDVVKEFPHPNLYLRELEDNIIEAMDSWAISDQEGYLVWITPSFEDHYPSHKIEILHKSYTERKTLNAAILFDGNQDICLRAAKEIFPELKNLENVEELRRSLVTRDNLDIGFILKIVDPYIPKDKNLKQVPKEVFDYIANLAISGVDQRYIALEMQRLEVTGQFSFSCPGGKGLMSLLEENSLNINQITKDGWHDGTCRVCGSSAWVGPCNICKPCESKF